MEGAALAVLCFDLLRFPTGDGTCSRKRDLMPRRAMFPQNKPAGSEDHSLRRC